MNKGFTLIEIIAVLVLLGVLAAVIVPRYNNIINDARSASTQQAVAEGQSRVSHAAAAFVLANNGNIPASCSALDTWRTLPTDVGDYTVAYADNAAPLGCLITATHTTSGMTGTGVAAFPVAN